MYELRFKPKECMKEVGYRNRKIEIPYSAYISQV